MVSQTRPRFGVTGDTLSWPAWAQGLVWLAINQTDVKIYTMQLLGKDSTQRLYIMMLFLDEL